jgi:hypothetical protein
MAWAKTYEEAVEKDAERFWSKVDKSKHPLGCWIWRGVIDQNTGRGHHDVGQFKGVAVREGRKKVKAHIWAYILTHGSRPLGHGGGRGASDVILAHTCDNGHGGCVNPHHLIPSTNAENQRDKWRAGTHGWQLWQKDRLIVKTIMKDLGISRDASFAEIADEVGVQPQEILRAAIKIYQSFIAEKFGVNTEFDFNEMAIKIKSSKLQRGGR